MEKDLVPLLPRTYDARTCPACGADGPVAEGFVIPGIHVMGDYSCRVCGHRFLHDLPVGFAVDHDVAISLADGQAHVRADVAPWVSGPLLESYRTPSDKEFAIERVVHTRHRRIVLLNTLDFLYGHVLLKLWNAQHYLERRPELGLVVIAPRSFAWMLPKGIAEAWLVDIRLGAAHGWYPSIDRQLKKFLADYEVVHMARGYAHPDKGRVDIARYTGVRPFQLEDHQRSAPHITFVLREDRLWYRHAWLKFMARAVNRLGLQRWLGGLFLADQHRMAMSVWRRFQQRFPEATATVVGLGDERPVPRGVKDLRTRTMDVNREREWCRAYARSHIVVGVHGSNMLLPTAHAAGCIEILPHDRHRNLAQDVAVRYYDVMQLFMYRFVDEFASPAIVARHAISMIEDYAVFHRNNRVNIY